MNKNKSQTGSVHLIITIILAVALLGLLGFELYQNFVLSKASKPTLTVVDKKTDETPKTETASEVALTEVASDTTGTGLAIKYPKTWILNHETTPASEMVGASDKNTIISSDGNVKVVLDIARPSGIGLNCGDPDTTIKVLDKGEIKNYSSLSFIRYNEPGVGDYVGVSKNIEVEGRTNCASYSKSQYIFSYSSSNPSPIATLQAKFTGDIDMNSDNYKTAKRIIQSLYVKN